MAFLKKRVGDGEASFGKTLREWREMRGFSVEELGRQSGIHPLILIALEEDRLEDLADPAYAERHIIALSEVLDCRSMHLRDKYQELLMQKGIVSEKALFPQARVRQSELFVRSRAVALFAFLVVVGLLGAYVFWQVKVISTVPHLVVDSPVEGAQLSAPTVIVSGKTDPGTFVTMNGFGVVVKPDGSFTASLDVTRGVSTVEIEAHRRYGAPVTIDRNVNYLVETK